MSSSTELLPSRLIRLQDHGNAVPERYQRDWVDVFGESLYLPIAQDAQGRDVVHSSALALERTETGGYRLCGFAQPASSFQALTVKARDAGDRESTIRLGKPHGDPVDAGSGQALSDSQCRSVAALLGLATQREVYCEPDDVHPDYLLLRYEVDEGRAWNDPSHLSVLLTVDPTDPGCARLLDCMLIVIDRQGASHALAVVRFPQERPDARPGTTQPLAPHEVTVHAPVSVPLVTSEATCEPIEPPRKRARGNLESALHDTGLLGGEAAHPQAPSVSLPVIPKLRDINAEGAATLWTTRMSSFAPLYQSWLNARSSGPLRTGTGGALLRELVVLCQAQQQLGHGEWIGRPERSIMSFQVQPAGQAQPREIWIGVRHGQTLDVRLPPVDDLGRDRLAREMAATLNYRVANWPKGRRDSDPIYAREVARHHWQRSKREFTDAYDKWLEVRTAHRPDGPEPSHRKPVGADFLFEVCALCDRTAGVSPPAHVKPFDGLGSHMIQIPGLAAPIEVWRLVEEDEVRDIRLAPQSPTARQTLRDFIFKNMALRDMFP